MTPRPKASPCSRISPIRSIRRRRYNATGQRERSLVEGQQSSGLYLQRWDGRDDAGRQVASGTYVYRLEMPAVGLSQTRTMPVVR